MKAIGWVRLVVVFIGLMSAVSISQAVAGTAMPASTSLATILKQQEPLSGASFQIAWATVTYRKGIDQSTKRRGRYVRTPRTLFYIDELCSGSGQNPDRWKASITTTSSYNRSTRRYITLETNHLDPSKRSARTGNGLESSMTVTAMYDPIYYFPVGSSQPLIQLVRRGKVIRYEIIDGAICWLLQVTDTYHTAVWKFNLWLDPSIDCMPRKVETFSPDTSRLYRMTRFNNYRQVASGVWCPTQIVTTNIDARKIYTKSITTIYRAIANQLVDENQLKVTIPSGIQVENIPGGQYSITP